VIQAIKNAPSHSANTSKGAISASKKGAIEDRRATGPQLPSVKSGGWLANLFTKATPANSRSARSATAIIEPNGLAEISTQVVDDAGQYNWSSFLCPYCNASSFIRCSGGHFACDGAVEMRSGRRFHQCFCGNAAFIEGAIKTFEANRSSLAVEPAAATKPPAHSGKEEFGKPLATALPSPMKVKPLAPSNDRR
jgi:hypothetical protein